MFQDGWAPPLSGPEAPRLVCSDSHPLSRLLWDRAARIPVPPCSPGPVTLGGLLGGLLGVLLHFPVGAVPMTAAPASPGPPWGLNALMPSESCGWGLRWGAGALWSRPSLSLHPTSLSPPHTPPGPTFFFPPSKPKTKPTSHSPGQVCFMRTREIKHSSQGLCQPGRASHSRLLTPGPPFHQAPGSSCREPDARPLLHSPERCSHLPKVTQLVSTRTGAVRPQRLRAGPQGYAGLGGGLALEGVSREDLTCSSVHSVTHPRSLRLLADLVFLEDVDCAVYFCSPQIPGAWRCSSGKGRSTHMKGYLGT